MSTPSWMAMPPTGKSTRRRMTGRGKQFAPPSSVFWPVFLAALAISWLIGLLSSSKAQAMYIGFQGFVFFLGLAVCSVVGWWPWILVMLGISAILEIANGLLQPGDKERW